MNKVAKIVIVDADNKYLLMKRDGHPTFGDDPDLPGGTIEPGEDPLDAMVREVYEEAGFVIDGSKARLLYEGTEYSAHGTHYSLYVTDVQDRPDVTISWEHAGYEWLGLEELLDKASSANDTYMHMVYDQLQIILKDMK